MSRENQWAKGAKRVFASSAVLLAIAAGCGDDDGVAGGGVGGGTGGGNIDAGIEPTLVDDADVAIVRITAAGAVDTTYGADGVSYIDLGSYDDAVAGIAVHPDAANANKVVIFGSATATPTAVDSARVIARVLADGSGLDTAFSPADADSAGPDAPGIDAFNIAGSNDSPKLGLIHADGSIIAPGYASQPTYVGMNNANRIILVRLDADGTRDADFGNGGVANLNPFADPVGTDHGMAEAYGIAALASRYVTTGYGRVTGSAAAVAQVNVGFTLSGQLDTEFGDIAPAPYATVASATVVHPNPSFEARGRAITRLPGDALLAVGSANGTQTPVPDGTNKDFMVAVLADTGSPTSVTFTGSRTDGAADGSRIIELAGGADYTDEAFFGAATAPSGAFAAAVGYRSGTAGGLAQDEDAALAIFGITTEGESTTTGVDVDYAAAEELSTTEADRFRAVVVSSDSTRIYASGYVGNADANRQAVVVCFEPSGARCAGFGTNGVVTVPVMPDATGIALDGAGNILVAGAVVREVEAPAAD